MAVKNLHSLLILKRWLVGDIHGKRLRGQSGTATTVFGKAPSLPFFHRRFLSDSQLEVVREYGSQGGDNNPPSELEDNNDVVSKFIEDLPAGPTG